MIKVVVSICTIIIATVIVGVAWSTHESTQEEHTVVFDPPPITTTFTDTDPLPHPVTETVRETTTVFVTTTPPTTSTEPPPTTTTEPPPDTPVTCLVSNRRQWEPEDCMFRTLVRITNGTQFHCSGSLATQFGPLPIKVEHVFTEVENYGDQGQIDLVSGCRGDSDQNTIDVIATSNADGLTVGSCGGAAKFRTAGPVDIQITGDFNSGPACSGPHPDVWQFHPTHVPARLDIVNGSSGDCEAGTSTTVGSGGSIFFSYEYDVDVYGGCYVTCNHGYFGNSTPNNQVIDATFKTGRVEPVSSGGDPVCQGRSASNPCIGEATFTNVTCLRWDPATNTFTPRPPVTNLTVTHMRQIQALTK